MSSPTRRKPSSSQAVRMPEGPPNSHSASKVVLNDPVLLFGLGLLNSPRDAVQAMQRRQVQVRAYSPLTQPFPQEHAFAAENQIILDRWQTYLATRKPADNRTPQGVLGLVHPHEWMDRIGRSASVHIVDQVTGASGGFVLRNVVSQDLSQLLESAHQVAIRNTCMGLNVRVSQRNL